MAKITDKQKEALIAMSLEVNDNGKPKYKQQELADKFGISKGMVSRYVSAKKEKSKQIIDDEVRIIGELLEIENEKSKHLSKQEQIEVNKQVSDRVRRENKFYSNAEKGLDKVHTMLDQIDTPNDALTLANANDRYGLSLGLVDRFAPKIDIQQLQQQNTTGTTTVNIIEDKVADD